MFLTWVRRMACRASFELVIWLASRKQGRRETHVGVPGEVTPDASFEVALSQKCVFV